MRKLINIVLLRQHNFELLMLQQKILNTVFWFVEALAIFMMFKSSDEFVIPAFRNTQVENWLSEFSTGNAVIFNLSIGFVVSSIFYFVVVYLPDRRKRALVDPYIFERVEEVIGRIHGLVREILLTAGQPNNNANFTNDNIIDACRKINPKEHISRFHNGPAHIFESHFGYKCFNHWMHAISTIDDAFKFLPYLDAEIVHHFNRIRKCNFNLGVINLRDLDHLGNTNMEPWAQSICEAYQMTKQLRDYYVFSCNRKFPGDPWQV